MEKVIIEIVVSAHVSGAALFSQIQEDLPAVEIDLSYEPIEIAPRAEDAVKVSSDEKVMVVRGTVAQGKRSMLEPNGVVLHVWSDGKIAPFQSD